MGRLSVVFPAGVLLLSFTVTSSAQNFTESPGVSSAIPSFPRVPLQQSTPQMPPAVDPSVITVRPELTDEQLGDLFMVRKQYREAWQFFNPLSDAAPQNAVNLNKLGISLNQRKPSLWP